MSDGEEPTGPDGGDPDLADGPETDGPDPSVSGTRRDLLKSTAALGVLPVASGIGAADRAGERWEVTGPDGQLTAVVEQSEAGAQLELSVEREGRTVIEPSPLGLSTSETEFTTGLTFEGRTDATDAGSWDLPHGKHASGEYQAALTTLAFSTDDGTPFEVDVRVGADGVAYRYRLPESGSLSVTGEAGAFRVPESSDGWLMPWTQNYEDHYEPESPTEAAGEYGYPLLFHTGSDWLLLTEADVDGRYAASRLTTAAGESTFDVTFPPGETVTTEGPLATPWRVAIVGDLGTVVESDHVLDVSPGSNLADASWVEPGRAAWSWWSEHDVEGPATQREFVDYAAEEGWEYVVVDAGWTDDWVPDLIDYANERGVEVFLWNRWNGGHERPLDESPPGLDEPDVREERLSRWADWGAAGIKVDYMNSDAQSMLQFHDDLLATAAEHELLVNFHGSTVPKGRRRRWPNLITSEAVQGAEWYKFGGEPTPTHNATLPFTRNVVGPMDYTPVTFSASLRTTSDAHELALAIVFESGIQHLADNPDEYASRPLAERLLRSVAAGWDETVFLRGHPGEEATLARRSGEDWFVGSIVAGEARTVEVTLDFLDDNRPRVAEITSDDSGGGDKGSGDQEGKDAGNGGLTVDHQEVRRGDTVSVDVPENGGFTIRLVDATEIEPTLAVDPAEVTVTDTESGTVEATVTNHGQQTRTQLALSLETPEGLSVEASENTSVKQLKSGESATGSWEIGASSELLPGTHDLVVSLASEKGKDTGELEDAQVTVVHPLDPLPEGWESTASTEARFGSVDQHDTVAIWANGTDVWVADDEYGALTQTDDSLKSHGSATVEVVAQEDTGTFAKAGIMAANDITAAGESAPDVTVFVTPGDGFHMEWDSDADGYVDTAEAGGETTYPGHVRLEREGTTFVGSYSTDGGDTWRTLGEVDLPGAADEQDIGLFATSHSSSLNLCEFDDFRSVDQTLSVSTPENDLFVPGQSATVETTVHNAGDRVIEDVDCSLDVPDGWSAETDSSTIRTVTAGGSGTVAWTVTPPADASAGQYDLAAGATFADSDGASRSLSEAARAVVPAPPAGDAYLSDLDWIDATVGWVFTPEDIGIDESIDGNTLTIDGQSYEKGIGTQARSEISYYLGGEVSRFQADVGIDDEVDAEGDVIFRVRGDGETLVETDSLTGDGGATSLDVDVSGVEVLELVADPNGSIDFDHADWADARVSE